MSELFLQPLKLGVLVPLVSLSLIPALYAEKLHTPPQTQVELGKVAWLRDLDKALQTAETENKPVFILFQEVPGCSTCRNYGAGALSHPLITEAIESLFVPVAIFNNHDGADREALRRFKEPAWNNPVVRIVDESGKDITQRLAGNYTESGLVESMRDALKQSEIPVPPYLKFLDEELHAKTHGTEQAVFAMSCFWSGEAKLGTLSGVVGTSPGFLHGEEVVEVSFDPNVISYENIVETAEKMKCNRKIFTRDEKQQQSAQRVMGDRAVPTGDPVVLDQQPKYHLLHTRLRHVPLTPLQASRVNSAVWGRRDPEYFLSPRQVKIFHLANRHPDAGWPVVLGREDLAEAFEEVETVAAKVRGKTGNTLRIERK